MKNSQPETDQNLRNSEEKLRILFECAGDSISVLDMQGKLLTVNPLSHKMLGYTYDELIALPLDKIDTRPELLPELIGIVVNRGHNTFDTELLRKDGSIVPVSVDSRLITWDGQPAILNICRDITERKRAEEEKLALQQQLHQSYKLESLGVLAGGIAHDFNNILAIINGYCYLVKMDCKTPEKHMPSIEKAVDRAAALCRQMLAYAGKSAFDSTEVNVSMLVVEMVKVLKSTINQNVVIKQDISADIPFVMGDAGQIHEIVMNLLTNASEAIGEEHGEISVSLAKTDITADQSCKDHLGKVIPPGLYVCMEVTDNGCGMNEQTQQRIFEPFYSTKFAGRGLGMSAVLGIITSHKGALQLSSRPSLGTSIKVYLPVQTGDFAVDEAIPQAAPVPWRGSGTILLVEDEEHILLITKTILKAVGFKVIEATNGREALELYHKNAADIRLVVTDMGMPIMDGYDLFHELKKISPDLPIIISSGFGDAVVTSRIPREHIAGLLSKPYNFDHLREVLTTVLAPVRTSEVTS